MRKSILFITAVSLSFAACQHNKTTSSESTLADSTFHDEHNAENSLDWAATYEGVLPCADCEGIKTTVELKDDLSYHLREEYINKDLVNEQNGSFNWNAEGNTVTLNTKEGAYKFFVGEEQIKFLDQAGQEITGTLADHYILKKK